MTSSHDFMPSGFCWIQPMGGVGRRADTGRVRLGCLTPSVDTPHLPTSLNQRPSLPATGRPMQGVTGISFPVQVMALSP